jgi:hypothetical protein
MFRAMAVKELREIRGIALLAIAAYTFVAGAAMNPYVVTRYVWPFWPGDIFVSWHIVISGALAVALGLRQTLGESIPGTYPFLLHRPADGRWLIGVKLLVGVSAYVLCGGLPILVYSLWAATPGTHASPFEWWMTTMTWVLWLWMTFVYLGAFLAGVRPVQWYRSRILPLAGAVAVPVGIGLLFGGIWWLWPNCLAILVLDALMISMILFVVRTRDYP